MGTEDFKIANLSEKEMEEIEKLEHSLGVALVAYEKKADSEKRDSRGEI
jgi:hypothetical protein